MTNQNLPKAMNKLPTAAGAMEKYYYFLPEDMILCILTRLPVKSLVRFKSVCRSWRELLATKGFMKMHMDQFSNNPRNESFIIHHRYEKVFRRPRISLLSGIDSSDEKKPTNLGHPFRNRLSTPVIVGCCNGMVCMDMVDLFAKPGYVVLWNPALKLFKYVARPNRDSKGPGCFLSLGFGYDAEEADFKVVIIVGKWKTENRGNNYNRLSVSEAVVYSANSDSWKTIELDFELNSLTLINDATVNGNPFWKNATIDGKPVLMWFDVRKYVFKNAPNLHPVRVRFVDWKGSVGAIIFDSWQNTSVEFWVLYDEKVWRKNYAYEFRPPIQQKWNPSRVFWQRSNGGKFIGEYEYGLKGTLFILDPETRCSEDILIGPRTPFSGIYRYSESLAYVKGMEQYL